LGPHAADAAFMGYTAGHPERSGGASQRPSLPYRRLSDAEVINEARKVYLELQRTPRWHNDNDILIRQWGQVCAEMNIRGLVDEITQSSGTPECPSVVSAS